MIAVIGGVDSYLNSRLGQFASSAGFRVLRTHKIERIVTELKQTDRLAIIDMNWEEVQGRGVLRQLVNIGHIGGNKIICICPNTEEELKKIARLSRVDEVFIRYDLTTRFKYYLETIILEAKRRKVAR